VKLIVRTKITEDNLQATNVPEDDAPLWVMAGDYDIGAQVIYEHRVYESLIDDNPDQPDQGAAATPATWLDLGPTNLYRSFDEAVGTQTTNPGTVQFTFRPGNVNNAVAIFNPFGATARVEVIDPNDGVVYDETMSLVDNTDITDWYAYFFEPIEPGTKDLVFLDLPQYALADIRITIDAGIEEAKCGEIVIGRIKLIGDAQYGTSVSIDDFSRKERDQFGNFIVVPRRFAKRASYDIVLDTLRIGTVQRVLSEIRTTPTVFIGDELREETILYGFYRDFNIVISGPVISDCSIEVEGLT
jgi:hypothetical protein